jgi:hypothetical protein
VSAVTRRIIETVTDQNQEIKESLISLSTQEGVDETYYLLNIGKKEEK